MKNSNRVNRYDDFDVNKTKEQIKQWQNLGLSEEILDMHRSFVMQERYENYLLRGKKNEKH